MQNSHNEEWHLYLKGCRYKHVYCLPKCHPWQTACPCLSRPQMFPLFPHPSTICHGCACLQGPCKSQLSWESHAEAFLSSAHELVMKHHFAPLMVLHLHHEFHVCPYLDTLKYRGVLWLIQVPPSPGPA